MSSGTADTYSSSISTLLRSWSCGMVSACPRTGYEMFELKDREVIHQLRSELLSKITADAMSCASCYHLPGNGDLRRMTETFAHWMNQWLNTKINNIHVKYEKNKQDTFCKVARNRSNRPIN